MIITEYREGDITGIMAVERDSFNAGWSEVIFLKEIFNPISRILIGRTVSSPENDVAGYIVFWRVLDEIHLHNIAVRKDQRRKGLAMELLHEAIHSCRSEGAKSMTLEVRRSNIPAQKLYKKIGFSVKGIRPRYYSDTDEDAMIMWMDFENLPAETVSFDESGKMNVCRKD